MQLIWTRVCRLAKGLVGPKPNEQILSMQFRHFPISKKDDLDQKITGVHLMMVSPC